MKFSAKIRQLGIQMTIACTLFFAAACDSTIYDYEGDCSVTYRIKFRYDMNMAFANAFSHEVNSVNVYAFDTTGVLVWQKSESGEILKAEDYAMNLDLKAGKYDLIAWCGLNNSPTRATGVAGETFSVPDMQVGKSTKDELLCTLSRKHDSEGQAYTDFDLHRLYHGMCQAVIVDDNDPAAVPGIYNIDMPLVKNTNRVRVILQQANGTDVNIDNFSFKIEEENGLMNYDNALLPDENITYWQWQKQIAEAGVDLELNDGIITHVNAGIADITVGRMMADRKMMITVTNLTTGKDIVRLPLVDYALLVKDNYETPMTNQEYLDRQDQFTLTLVLAGDRTWDDDNLLGVAIYINSWRVVVNDSDL